MKDKRILIVGSRGKIGKGLTAALMAMGCRLFEHSREIADLRSVKDIKDLVVKARRSLGGLDAVIDCSGLFLKGPIVKLREKDWDELFAVNLKSKVFLAKEAAAILRKGKDPSILFFADTYWRSPSKNFVAYGVSKAGLVALTKGLAKEFAPDIRVNAIAPGIVDTGGRFSAAEKRVIKQTALKKAVPLVDIVNAVIFAILSRSLTGEIVTIDGGRYV